MVEYILFFIGFVLLLKGGDILVDGSVVAAKKLGISQLAIGLTIVAFGTSAPEFAVNIIASLQGHAAVALGNILGSNIANILLILGVAALINPLTVQKSTILREIPFSLLAVIVLAILTNDILLEGHSDAMISRGDGLILLTFFSIFLYYVFSVMKSGPEEEGESSDMSTLKAVLYIVGGCVGLVIGAQWIVDGAITIALAAGISQRVVGLTIVAIGTSLPELAASAIAARRGNSDIAIGNVVGSNIFNIFWVLAVSAAITPLPIEEGINLDLALLVLSSLLLMGTLLVGRNHMIKSRHGLLFLVLYAFYMVRLFL